MDGIKLHLLCGVRIELAVGFLDYSGKSGLPIISPGRGRLIWISNRKPCLDVLEYLSLKESDNCFSIFTSLSYYVCSAWWAFLLQ